MDKMKRIICCYYFVSSGEFIGASSGFSYCTAPDTHHCQNEDCPAYFTRKSMNVVML